MTHVPMQPSCCEAAENSKMALQHPKQMNIGPVVRVCQWLNVAFPKAFLPSSMQQKAVATRNCRSPWDVYDTKGGQDRRRTFDQAQRTSQVL